MDVDGTRDSPVDFDFQIREQARKDAFAPIW